MLSGINNVVGAHCEGDIRQLITQCAPYIEKSRPTKDPSQKCCNVAKKVNFSCVCLNLTKEFLHLLDMHKINYVAKFCGNPIPPGTKCGGI